jgi:small-conductance mechanosensitive channel
MVAAARASGPENAKWIETVGRAARYALSVVTLLVAGMLVLNELGISIAPILGAAGVVGLAIGFGAQSLIKDYFTGFFLLVENQIRVGDVVEIAGKSGLVEEVSLRKVRLRDYDGSVHYVSNGLITTVTNRSTEFSFALIDIGIAYKSNIDQAIDVLRQVAADMRQDPVLGSRSLPTSRSPAWRASATRPSCCAAGCACCRWRNGRCGVPSSSASRRRSTPTASRSRSRIARCTWAAGPSRHSRLPSPSRSATRQAEPGVNAARATLLPAPADALTRAPLFEAAIAPTRLPAAARAT